MKIVTFSYIPTHFGFFMPWASASLIFSPPILLILAIANLGHIALMEWSQNRRLRDSKKLILIYLVFVAGIACEFPSLSADTMGSLQHSANVENKPLENASNWAVLYAIVGSFLFEIYYTYFYKIEKRILYTILSRI